MRIAFLLITVIGCHQPAPGTVLSVTALDDGTSLVLWEKTGLRQGRIERVGQDLEILWSRDLSFQPEFEEVPIILGDVAVVRTRVFDEERHIETFDLAKGTHRETRVVGLRPTGVFLDFGWKGAFYEVLENARNRSTLLKFDPHEQVELDRIELSGKPSRIVLGSKYALVSDLPALTIDENAQVHERANWGRCVDLEGNLIQPPGVTNDRCYLYNSRVAVPVSGGWDDLTVWSPDGEVVATIPRSAPALVFAGVEQAALEPRFTPIMSSDGIVLVDWTESRAVWRVDRKTFMPTIARSGARWYLFGRRAGEVGVLDANTGKLVSAKRLVARDLDLPRPSNFSEDAVWVSRHVETRDAHEALAKLDPITLERVAGFDIEVVDVRNEPPWRGLP
jgi:hypothetical protein